MRWTLLLLAVLVLLSACTMAPEIDQGEPLGCDEIGSETECLANLDCDTIYRTIFTANPQTGGYTSQDVYQNCAVKGALR